MKLRREFWVRRAVVLTNALVLVIGLICVVAGAAATHEGITAAVVAAVGGALFSASLVALVLGATLAREQIEQLDSALMRGLQDVLVPIKVPLYAGALASYRYDCLLTCPPPGDPHPDYLYQSIRISYRVSTLPATLSLVCAASHDDAVLEEFTGEGYLLRWMVDDHLDVSDPAIFTVGDVIVDNEELPHRAGTEQGAPGGRVRVETFTVPRKLRHTTGHQVDFQITTRKYAGADRRLRIQAQLFRHVTDAEYRLTIDPALGVERLHVSASEVSALGTSLAARMRPTYTGVHGRHAGIVQLPFPLQPGSAVAFLIERTPPARTA